MLFRSQAGQALESLLAQAIDQGLAKDAAISETMAQFKAIWALRENVSEAQAAEGKNIKHDISVPISEIPRFIRETDAALQKAHPGIRMVCFGHLGDGNLHYNIAPPLGVNASEFNRAHEEVIHDVVYSQVEKHHGSISAEHEIGRAHV